MSPAPLKPCLLARKTVPKIWGGRALEQIPGIPLELAGPIGETWELYDRPEGSSAIRGSTATVHDLMLQDPLALLGRGVPPGHGGHFPLLLKFIDAHESLSVQVHPDDDQALHERDSGKSEAWVVLAAGPNARVIRGIRPGVSEEEFRRVAATKAVESVLWSFRPEVGDCIHVPAGTVHAIGPDVVVFEVQQNSDITYRLYDWGRERPVHVQQALAATRFDGAAAGRPVVIAQRLPDGGQLVLHEPHFRLRRYHLTERHVMPTNAAYVVFTVIAGRGMLGWHSAGNDEPLHLQPGDTALVPACVPQVFLSPIGKLHVLVSDPGKT